MKKENESVIQEKFKTLIGGQALIEGIMMQLSLIHILYDSDERVRELVDTAKAIEGMPRNTSTHAAGVVITKLPVYDYVPLATNDGTIVTEYTMTTLEELGLLKMDFLGLRNITVIDDAIRDIRKTEPDFSMARVTDNDPKVCLLYTSRCV